MNILALNLIMALENAVASQASSSNLTAMLNTLPYMAKGMAGIFIVTLVIILVMVLLNKFTGSKS